MGLIFIVCAAGMIIGALTARRSGDIRFAAVLLSPLIVWLGLLLIGCIESLRSGVFARGIGAVLMISLGYWLFLAWAVALACFLGQSICSKAGTKRNA